MLRFCRATLNCLEVDVRVRLRPKSISLPLRIEMTFAGSLFRFRPDVDTAGLAQMDLGLARLGLCRPKILFSQISVNKRRYFITRHLYLVLKPSVCCV